MKKARVSYITLWVLLALLVIGRVWKPNRNVLSWDTAGYYLYLPAVCIYHDPKLTDYSRVDSLRVKYGFSDTFYQVYKSPKGGYYIKYTMGSAILYSPFFAIGHVMAKIGGYPADGFSAPYQNAMMLGCLLYAFLSLVMARKILLYFFPDKVTAFTLVCLVLGTNLYFMLAMDNLQVHCLLFLLYTGLLWRTIRFHLQPDYVNAVGMGLMAGLIVITRPTDAISWLIPVLWGVNSAASLWKKIRENFRYLVVFGIVAAACFLPQMLYWKFTAGEWLFNSYNNAGEGLDLRSPHTIPFLFSYRKGWLLYTPMAFFSVLGIFFTRRKKPFLFIPLLFYFALNLWLISSWTCWWYAGSFSSRAMVQAYAVLMIPLGFFVHWVFTRRQLVSHVFRTLLILLVVLSVFQTWQYAQGILKMDGMTKKFYWNSFGRTTPDPRLDKFLLHQKSLSGDTLPDRENFRVGEEYTFDFNNRYGLDVETLSRFEQAPGDSDWSLKLDSAHIFYTLAEEPYSAMTQKYYAYVRITGKILNTGGKENPVELVRHMLYQGNMYAYSSHTLPSSDTGSVHSWKTFTVDYIFPDVRTPDDRFKTYFWLRGTQPVYIKDVHMEVLEAKEFPELE